MLVLPFKAIMSSFCNSTIKTSPFVLEAIFCYLPEKDAGKAAQVCKHWKNALTLFPKRTGYALEVGQKKLNYRMCVLSEIPATIRFHRLFIKILHQNNVLVSKLPVVHIVDSSIDKPIPNMPLPMAKFKNENSEKIGFRVIGDIRNLNNLFPRHNMTFGNQVRQVKAVFEIFQLGGVLCRWQANFACLDPNPFIKSFSYVSGRAPVLNHLVPILANPISIIWLYCGGDAPYVDLHKYIPVQNHTMSLY